MVQASNQYGNRAPRQAGGRQQYQAGGRPQNRGSVGGQMTGGVRQQIPQQQKPMQGAQANYYQLAQQQGRPVQQEDLASKLTAATPQVSKAMYRLF